MKTVKNIKSISLSLAVVSAIGLGFVGCGGGGSGGTDTPATTSVEVERGKVYDSIVTDATGKVATKTTGSNIYVFSGTPTYPITATGGWIDLDGNGAMTTDDIELDVTLTSYSNVITPITTYIADANSATREQKLQELTLSLGTTSENLLKVPSKGTKDTIIAANAIFTDIKAVPNRLPTALNFTDINSTLTALKTTYNQSFSGQTDMTILAKDFEQAVVSANSGLFTKLTNTKIATIEASRPQTIPVEEKPTTSLNIDSFIDDTFKTNNSKSEFETTTEYETRIKNKIASIPSSNVLDIKAYSMKDLGYQGISNYSMSYNAGQSKMQIDIQFDNRDSYDTSILSKATFLGAGFNVLASKTNSSYEATNGFGAKVTVAKTEILNSIFVFSNISSASQFKISTTGEASCTQGSNSKITCSVFVSENSTAAQNYEIGYKLDVQISELKRENDFSFTNATYTSPYQTNIWTDYYPVKFNSIVLYNKTTGKEIAKLSI